MPWLPSIDGMIMKENIKYETIFDPQQEDLKRIDRGLHEFDASFLGESVIMDYDKLAVFARDEEGNVIGGLHGELVWEWFYIKTMWVEDDYRGYAIGTRLLSMAEEAAASRGFHKVHLETTGFQALGFYLKNGYEVFGKLEGKPTGTTWYFLKKEELPSDQPAPEYLRDI